MCKAPPTETSEPAADPRASPDGAGPCPRERLIRFGPEVLSDAELVGLLLRLRGKPTELASGLLQHTNGLTGLLGLDLPSLRHHGLSEAKALQVLVAGELSRRQARQKLTGQWMQRPEEVAQYLFLRYGNIDQEVMGALFVDMRNVLIVEAELFRGTMRRAWVDPRTILREALIRRAAGLLLFHTHPGGAPEPSPEDLKFTLTMAEACELMEVRLMDHLILGVEGTWVSVKQLGHKR